MRRACYPQPGYTEADFDALLASRQFVFADVYTITLVDGITQYRYTNAQQDVNQVVEVGGVGRQTYLARDVNISGLRFKISVGTEVDEQTVVFGYRETSTIQGMIWPRALLWGRLDGAIITRDRFFAASWGAANTPTAWVAGQPMFKGRVSTLDKVGRLEASVKVKSALVLLNINMPRELWQPNCRNTWGDAGCGIDQSLYAQTVTMSGTPTTTFLPWSSATANFALGKVHIENGDAVTRVRSVKSIEVGVGVDLVYPLDFTPASGDMFAIFPGCRRNFSDCDTLYSNTAKFRGFPFVPVAETAL